MTVACLPEFLRSSEASSARHELVGPASAPVILVLGGISATSRVVRSDPDATPGWWEGIVGPGRAIDITAHRVISVAYRDGGRGDDGRPASVVTTHDQAADIVALLDDLGIERLSAIVAASYGGMVALALAERWPDRVDRLVAISAAHEPHPMATAIRSVQRRIVELGIETGRINESMALARALAMTTYRAAREFADRFDTAAVMDESRTTFDVERYLMRAGEKFAARMSPERFLALSLSVDLHRVVPEDIDVRTTVIAARGDTIVPPAQLRAMSRRLQKLDGFHTLMTRTGHDAFLAEQRSLGRLLTSILAD